MECLLQCLLRSKVFHWDEARLLQFVLQTGDCDQYQTPANHAHHTRDNRGYPVLLRRDNDEQPFAVEAKAIEVAGAGNVTNEMSVAKKP